MTMWVVRNDSMSTELIEEGFVSIGWDEIGDPRLLGDDVAALRAALVEAIPGAKPGAYPLWAGIVRRFAFEIAEGDIVIAPFSESRTLNFGEVVGPFEFAQGAESQRFRRRVRWLKTGVARSLFPADALRELGAIMTLFQVRRHEDVFRAFLAVSDDESFRRARPEPAPVVVDEDEALATAPRTASDIEQETQDAITEVLLRDLSHEEFEHFTADLLRATGYQARVTQYSSDGGVDVIAHRDPLGLEPPIIKVQCKHTPSTQGRPEVQKLLGTLATGELGLFVTLGTYSQEAFAVERGRRDLRLLGGADVTRLVLEHYADLPRRWRDRMPLRQVWVLDRDITQGA